MLARNKSTRVKTQHEITLADIEEHLNKLDKRIVKDAKRAEYYVLISARIALIALGLSTFSANKNWLDLVVVAIGLALTIFSISVTRKYR